MSRWPNSSGRPGKVDVAADGTAGAWLLARGGAATRRPPLDARGPPDPGRAGREADPVIATLRGGRARPELIDYLTAAGLAARGRHAEAARLLVGVAPALGGLPEIRG